MQDLLANFPFRKISIFVIIIGSFTYNVLLDRNVGCACKGVDIDCWVYLLSPAFIIFILILCIDKKMRTACRYSCACTRPCKCCRFFGVVISHILKAICVGLLWIVSVLIDGDWYVCCNVGRSEQQAKIACSDRTNITSEEKEIITEEKNVSRVSISSFIHSIKQWSEKHRHTLLSYFLLRDTALVCSFSSFFWWPSSHCAVGGNASTAGTAEELFLTWWSWQRRGTFGKRFWRKQEKRSWLEKSITK